MSREDDTSSENGGSGTSTDPTAAGSSSSNPSPPVLPFAQTAFYEVSELDEALNRVREATLRHQAEPGDPEVQRAFYESLAQMGWVTAFLDASVPSDHETLVRIRRGLNVIATNPTNRGTLERFGKAWLDPGSRTNDGIVLVGTVEASETVGPYTETTMKLPGGRSVALVAEKADAPTLEAGAEIVALGAVVQQPAKRLPGYKGDAKSAVYQGLVVVTEPAAPVVEEQPVEDSDPVPAPTTTDDE
ncbi:MAG: hypothetical protein R3324_12120, partial [Halobacteriales archaeon]|nr:hypothetical protein [Halobacteriales archaeon]